MAKINFTILDPMGNLTALVETKTPKSRRSLVVKKIMADYPTVEQVGFLENKTFTMMGEELSINGTLAAGYYLAEMTSPSPLLSGEGFSFTSSGVFGKIKYFLKDNLPTISLVIPYKIVKIDDFDFVDLGGIGYFVIEIAASLVSLSPRNDEFVKLFEVFRKKFEKRLNRNAWGVVFYKGNRIWPVVYVKDKKGKVLEKRLEMACGSGSLAYSLISNQEKIIQPSGEIIRIKRKGEKFEISGKVKILASKEVVLRG